MPADSGTTGAPNTERAGYMAEGVSGSEADELFPERCTCSRHAGEIVCTGLQLESGRDLGLEHVDVVVELKWARVGLDQGTGNKLGSRAGGPVRFGETVEAQADGSR